MSNQTAQQRQAVPVCGLKAVLCVSAILLAAGCSSTGRVALLSNGELESKHLAGLSSVGKGPVLQGSSCGHQHSLSDAFRDALEETGYDTLLNVDVETTTGIFVWSNCINVRGYGFDSGTLPTKGSTS